MWGSRALYAYGNAGTSWAVTVCAIFKSPFLESYDDRYEKGVANILAIKRRERVATQGKSAGGRQKKERRSKLRLYVEITSGIKKSERFERQLQQRLLLHFMRRVRSCGWAG